MIIKETKGYSGTDIEAVIKNTIENVFINKTNLIKTENILSEIKETQPMSVALKDKIDTLRAALKNIDVKKASAKGAVESVVSGIIDANKLSSFL